MTTLSATSLAWTHPLERGFPPLWASDWGEDALYGGWCSFAVGDVVQRLRWIPPGTCWMGSPEDEEGRFPDESPRHLVTIQSGFWMFDTPCTQALWQAVLGENPSHFQNIGRPHQTEKCPVESVNWVRCQDFAKLLNTELKGLALSLPSEAQWEYACRAGTQTARYGENLNAIAWYAKNGGRKTHPVAGKDPNRWGLYDMLGNVYEWCTDAWTNNYAESARVDPSAPRVFRGGSWGSRARSVRAACRSSIEPTGRGSYLGVRFCEFREPSVVSRGSSARRAREARRRGGAAWA
jgi:formylglycine-generating enzyme required for sulfatase activity